MSLGQKLINRAGALARKIKRNPLIDFENVNEQTAVLSASAGAQQLILSSQRQTDPSFGLAVLAQKIEVAKLVAQDVALANVDSQLQATISNVGFPEIVSFLTYADDPSGTAQVLDILCVADNGGSLNNQYFLLNSANNEDQYYVWFNVGGNGVDPEISYRQPIVVDIYTNSPAPVVAAALASALSAAYGGADFTASSSGDECVVTYNQVGPARLPGPATNPILPGETDFTFSIAILGQNALSLNNAYFVLNDTNGSVAVWYNVDSAGTAPVGFNRTIEIDIASLSSAEVVASATAAVLAADSMFNATADGSTLAIQNLQSGNFGAPGNGTSTFLLSILQVGTLDLENLLHIQAGDLMEVLSGELIGQFFTIASITNNVLLMTESGVGETGESGISVRFEMRTTIPAIYDTPSEQV